LGQLGFHWLSLLGEIWVVGKGGGPSREVYHFFLQISPGNLGVVSKGQGFLWFTRFGEEPPKGRILSGVFQGIYPGGILLGIGQFFLWTFTGFGSLLFFGRGLTPKGFIFLQGFSPRNSLGNPPLGIFPLGEEGSLVNGFPWEVPGPLGGPLLRALRVSNFPFNFTHSGAPGFYQKVAPGGSPL